VEEGEEVVPIVHQYDRCDGLGELLAFALGIGTGSSSNRTAGTTRATASVHSTPGSGGGATLILFRYHT
jgi:hypothetical protein